MTKLLFKLNITILEGPCRSNFFFYKVPLFTSLKMAIHKRSSIDPFLKHLVVTYSRHISFTQLNLKY